MDSQLHFIAIVVVLAKKYFSSIVSGTKSFKNEQIFRTELYSIIIFKWNVF